MTQPSSSQPNRAVTCVLWRVSGVATPDKLLRSLAKKGVRVLEADSPAMAMAHVCAQERSRQLQTLTTEQHPPRPPQPASGTVLLLVEPTQLHDVGHVIDLVQRYAPRTVCWRYDAHASPALRSITDRDVRHWLPSQNTDESICADSSQPEQPKSAPRASSPPSLRLTDEHEPAHKRTKQDTPTNRSDLDDRFETTDRSNLVLTQEELAMLLADHIGQLDTEPHDNPATRSSKNDD